MVERISTLILTASCLVLFGCAVPKKKQAGDYVYDEKSQAIGAAYAAEGFTFKKNEPAHPDLRPWQFFYKKCQLSGEEIYYSPHLYSCSGPVY